MLRKSGQTGQLKKISLVSVGNITNSIMGALFITSLARTLPLDDFGKYALLTSLLVAMSKIIDFGSNSYYVADSLTYEEFKTETFLGMKVLLYFVTLPISFAAMYLLGILNYTSALIFSLGLLGYGINLILYTFFQKLEKFNFAVGINTLPALTKGFVGFLVFFEIIKLNLNQSFSVFAFSIFLSSVFIVVLPKQFKKLTFSLDNFKKALIETYPAGVSILITNSWSAISNSIAKFARNFADVGIFSIADRIANIFSLISFSIFTVLLPKNARRKSKKLDYDLKETLLISTIIFVLASGSVLVSRIAFIPIFGEKFSDSMLLLDILIFSSAFTSIHTFIDNYFYVEKETKKLMSITLAKLAIFLGISALLVPIYDLTGLAISNLASSIFALIITLLVVRTNIRKNSALN